MSNVREALVHVTKTEIIFSHMLFQLTIMLFRTSINGLMIVASAALHE